MRELWYNSRTLAGEMLAHLTIHANGARESYKARGITMFLIYGLKVQGNQVVYVGYTQSDRFERRMGEHYRQQTLGSQEFVPVVLFENIPSIDEALEMEKVYVDVYNTFTDGYNQTRGGGKNTEVSIATRRKISVSTRKQIKDGKHPFVGGEVSRRNTKKHLEAGTHNFLGGDVQRRNNNRRVKEGTHPWLGPEHNRKQIEAGTHPWLGRNVNILNHLQRNKKKVVFLYAVMIPKSYWEALNKMYRQRKLTRDGFYNAEIPDTSNGTQLNLF